MKLQIPFKLLAIALLIPVLVSANTIPILKKTSKEKTISKSFDVNSDATLKVINSYGNLDVVTWDENRITFDITIKVTGGSDEKAQERLNEIEVDFSNTSDMVTAVTKFGNKKKSWWSWGKNKNLKIEVNYRIKMPVTNNVNLNNDYGSINLGKLEGHAKINCDYGKITTQELMADNNEIRFDYTNNSYFEYIKSGEINADYSSYTVGKTKNLHINADYTKSTVEASENIKYNCDYGSVKIENANNVQGNGNYLTLRLGHIYKNVDVKADYGSIKIERMASKAGNININSDYTGITIGIDSDYNFNFNVDLEYASLKYTDNFNFTHKNVKSFNKKYSGYHGSQDSGNTVTINSEYGSVSFKEQ